MASWAEPCATEIGKPDEQPEIEILPAENPVPERKPVPADVPEREPVPA